MANSMPSPGDKDIEDSFRSYHFAEKTQDEPSIRIMALHALAYCQRLFYLEEVEEIRVASARVFAGRELHASLAADEEGDALTLELASEEFGLLGKVDCIRRRDGTY